MYADSLNPGNVTRFSIQRSRVARIRPRHRSLRNSIAKVRALPCDAIISVHPDASDVLDKAAANARDPSKNAFLDPNSCRAYADDYEQNLDARLQEERGGKPEQ